MKKIAIVGKSRSGKSTALDFIAKQYEKHGLVVYQYDISHALYKITEKLFPGSVYGQNKDRAKLQLVGQAIREYDKNFWIKAMDNAILNDLAGADRVDVLIITGVRQKNEYYYLKQHDFTIVKIISPEFNRISRAKQAKDVDYKNTFKHSSEKYIDKMKADFIIENKSTKLDFYKDLEILLGEI